MRDTASLPLIYLLWVHLWLTSVRREICKWLWFPWDILWSGFDGNVSGLKWSMRSGPDNCWFHLYSQQGCQRSLVIHPPSAPDWSGGLFPLPLLQPCLWVPGPSPVSWQRVQWPSFDKCNLGSPGIMHVQSPEALSSMFSPSEVFFIYWNGLF